LVEAIGAKRVGLAGLAGTALAFALFPAAGRLRSPRAVTALVWLMAVMGVFQGPLSPVLMQTNTKTGTLLLFFLVVVAIFPVRD
jgi:hypothetical protein